MRWIRLDIEKNIRGAVFEELTLTERGLFWTLLLLAGDSIEKGIVQLREGVAWPIPFLAKYINCGEEELQKGLEKLEKTGRISLLADKRIKIENWELYRTEYERKKERKMGKREVNEEGIEEEGEPMEREMSDEEIEFENLCTKALIAWNSFAMKGKKWRVRKRFRKEEREILYDFFKHGDGQISDIENALSNYMELWKEDNPYLINFATLGEFIKKGGVEKYAFITREKMEEL